MVRSGCKKWGHTSTVQRIKEGQEVMTICFEALFWIVATLCVGIKIPKHLLIVAFRRGLHRVSNRIIKVLKHFLVPIGDEFQSEKNRERKGQEQKAVRSDNKKLK